MAIAAVGASRSSASMIHPEVDLEFTEYGVYTSMRVVVFIAYRFIKISQQQQSIIEFMAGSDILLTIAEIAIAFAGFSSIVAVLGQRTSGRWDRADLFRLAAMVQSSLVTLLFALLPLCLGFLGLGEPAAWLSASILLAAVMVLLTSVSHLRARSLYSPAGSSSAGTSRGIAAAMLLLGGLIVALQICNIFDLVFERGPGPYISGLVLLLGISAVQFVRLLFPGVIDAE